jgi:hypothetical protein
MLKVTQLDKYTTHQSPINNYKIQKVEELRIYLFFNSRYSELHRQRFNLREKNSQADRKVPNQPNVFYGNDGKVSR